MVSFAELKERKMVQWAFAYVAGAWALLQVADLLSDAHGWPAVVMRVLPVLLLVGLLAALVLAWFHGEKGAQKVSGMRRSPEWRSGCSRAFSRSPAAVPALRRSPAWARRLAGADPCHRCGARHVQCGRGLPGPRAGSTRHERRSAHRHPAPGAPEGLRSPSRPGAANIQYAVSTGTSRSTCVRARHCVSFLSRCSTDFRSPA